MTPQLKPILYFNALLSLLAGALLLLAPGLIGGWLGVNIDGWLRAIGLVLISHGALIAGLVPRLGARRVAIMNLLAIGPYPILMIALVATGLISRTLGQVLALVDGAIIAAVAGVLVSRLRQPALRRQPTAA